MAEFAGIVRRGGGGIDPAIPARLERAMVGVGRIGRWRGDDCILLCRAHWNREVGDALRQPVPCGASGSLVADIALDEPGDTARQLGKTGRRWRDAELAAAACEVWGDDAPARLRGGFSFAWWDDARRQLMLARDPIGARSVFYFEHADYLIFASLLQPLLTLPEVPRDIDERVLAQMITLDQRDDSRTLYRAIRVVPAGAMAVFAPSRSTVRRYWTADDIAPVRFARDQDYVEAGREIFTRAVVRRIGGHERVATTVSGGLDSSGIAATLARLPSAGTFDAFHRAPAGAHPYRNAVDERATVLELAARYPRMNLHVVDRPTVSNGVAEPEWEAGITAMPRLGGVDGRWFDTMIDDVVRHDPDILFLGDCGNATLSWNGSSHVGADLVRGRWARAWRGIVGTANRHNQSLVESALRQIVGPLLPRSLRRWRQKRALGEETPWASYSMVSPDFLASLDFREHAAATGHDVPFAPTSNDFTARRLANIRGRAHRDGGGVSRRHWRFEVRDPYADRDLVEFTLGIPQQQYWRAGTDRWLARRVFADRLPRSIVEEWRIGRQCPEWYTDVTARRDGMAAAIDRIERSPLATRVVDVARMRRLLDDWPVDAETAKDHKQILGHALQRGIALGGFLRWHEGGNG